jgi:hypothetical protein
MFHVVEGIAAADNAAESDYQHVDQLVFPRAIDAGISEDLEVFDQAANAFGLHGQLFPEPKAKSASNLQKVFRCVCPALRKQRHNRFQATLKSPLLNGKKIAGS